MKAGPDAQGGLRILLENEHDLMAFRPVVRDAQSHVETLTEEMANAMPHEKRADWREFVTPELQDHYSSALERVQKALAQAQVGKVIHVPRDELETWYSVFNQARLALQQPPAYDAHVNNPWHARRQFYQIFQNILLQFLVKT